MPATRKTPWNRTHDGISAQWVRVADDWNKRHAMLDKLTLAPGILRLFACACCREIWPLLTDERSRAAVEIAEQYADGVAGDAILRTARDGAWHRQPRATGAARAGRALRSDGRAWRYLPVSSVRSTQASSTIR